MIASGSERGNLVVTVLEKDNFLLRYDLEDIVRWNMKPCPCGETHRRLLYEGRVRDLVAAGTREVLPIDVALVLYEFPDVSTPSAEYQIVRKKQRSETLNVRLEYDPVQISDVGGISRRLAERFRERLDVAVAITWSRAWWTSKYRTSDWWHRRLACAPRLEAGATLDPQQLSENASGP